MKAKLKLHKLLSMLLALVMVIGMLPSTGQVTYAAGTSGGVCELYEEGTEAWNVKMSDDGILSWDAQDGATGYNIRFSVYSDGSGTVFQKDGLTDTSFDVKSNFEKYKKENGIYPFIITATGVGASPIMKVQYVSALPKLSEPQDLKWDGTKATWKAVANATAYEVALVGATGSQVTSKEVTGTEFDFGASYSTYVDDGCWFKVTAIADGYRNSNTAESPKYGIYTTISSVNLTDFVPPSANTTASTEPTATIESGKGYKKLTYCWSDSDGFIIDDSTVFESGKTYYAALGLIANDGYVFAENLTATVNGGAVTVEKVELGSFLIANDMANVVVKFTIPGDASTYTVSFNANGGTGTMEDMIVKKGTASRFYQLPENGFTAPAGKYFMGWGIGPNSTRVIPPSTNFSLGADITFYAIWGDITCIDSVDVTVAKPVAGAHPQAAVSNTENVSVATEWYEYNYATYTKLSASDIFEAGKTYIVTVDLMIGGVAYKFADNTTVTINGSTISEVLMDATEIVVEKMFTATETPTGYTVSGTATSFGSDTGDVFIQLIESGAPEASYEAVVQGNSASYAITDVAPGTYTMKVMKKNHVTREYTVTVSAENVTQNVKIHLLGDVNGNGRIQSNDLTMVYAHVSGAALITDSYILACADVNGNGRIQSNDITRILGHVSGGNPLW